MIRSKNMRFAAPCLAAVLAFGIFATDASGQDDAELGPAVGAKASDFKLKDQHGKERSLQELLKKQKQVALVFIRSTSW